MGENVYFDNAATTKVDENVLKVMIPYFNESYGNASSIHSLGIEARHAIEASREIVAKSLNANKGEIIFTSGGTEGNNLALKGAFFANPGKNHIIVSKIEHDCVLNSCKWLEEQGAEITYLNVNSEGFVDVEELEKSITDKTLLVSIIHANNETGVIQDMEKIGAVCKANKVLFHTDACQSFTKTELDVEKFNLDLVTINAHKLHGPKGVGALYVRKGVKLVPLFHGGGHEKKLRSGTENVSGIVGFAEAIKFADKKYIRQIEDLRDMLVSGVLKIPGVKINGPLLEKTRNRICNMININFQNIEGEGVGSYLDSYGICVSTGSACTSNTLNPSHVLGAMGLSHLETNSSIRVSLSRFNTKKEVEYFLETLLGVVDKLREMSPVKLKNV
jgi:cysteine desulfurase